MAQSLDIKQEPIIIWEKLPENFALTDEPVENICQPLLTNKNIYLAFTSKYLSMYSKVNNRR